MCKLLIQYYSHFPVYPLLDKNTELSPAYYKFTILNCVQIQDFSSPFLGFAIPADLLAISLLEESAPLTSCSVQVAICPEDEREEGEPMRD